MSLTQNFSYKKSTQAINFFATMQNGVIDKLKTLKLIYFADRYHIRKYGRLITNDNYFAMDYGPVASGTKDIIELNNFLSEIEKDYAIRFIEPTTDFNYIRSIKKVNLEEFSASEIEALKYISGKYQKLGSIELSEITHKYPDWQKKSKFLNPGQVSRVGMDLIDFFEDPSDPNIDKIYQLTEDEKAAKIEYLIELNSLNKLWS